MVRSLGYSLIRYAGPHYLSSDLPMTFHVWGRSWIVIDFSLALWFANLVETPCGKWVGMDDTHYLVRQRSASSVSWGIIAAIDTQTQFCICQPAGNEEKRTPIIGDHRSFV